MRRLRFSRLDSAAWTGPSGLGLDWGLDWGAWDWAA